VLALVFFCFSTSIGVFQPTATGLAVEVGQAWRRRPTRLAVRGGKGAGSVRAMVCTRGGAVVPGAVYRTSRVSATRKKCHVRSIGFPDGRDTPASPRAEPGRHS